MEIRGHTGVYTRRRPDSKRWSDRIKKDLGVVYGEKISMNGKKFRSVVVAALDVK